MSLSSFAASEAADDQAFAENHGRELTPTSETNSKHYEYASGGASGGWRHLSKARNDGGQGVEEVELSTHGELPESTNGGWTEDGEQKADAVGIAIANTESDEEEDEEEDEVPDEDESSKVRTEKENVSEALDSTNEKSQSKTGGVNDTSSKPDTTIDQDEEEIEDKTDNVSSDKKEKPTSKRTSRKRTVSSEAAEDKEMDQAEEEPIEETEMQVEVPTSKSTKKGRAGAGRSPRNAKRAGAEKKVETNGPDDTAEAKVMSEEPKSNRRSGRAAAGAKATSDDEPVVSTTTAEPEGDESPVRNLRKRRKEEPSDVELSAEETKSPRAKLRHDKEPVSTTSPVVEPHSLRKRESSNSTTEEPRKKVATPVTKTPKSAKNAKKGRAVAAEKEEKGIFDFDPDAESEDAERPALRNVSVTKSAFGQANFTKSMSDGSMTPKATKYSITSKMGVQTTPAISSSSSSPISSTFAQFRNIRYLDKPENVIAKEAESAKKRARGGGSTKGKASPIGKQRDIGLFDEVTSRFDDTRKPFEETEMMESTSRTPHTAKKQRGSTTTPAATPKQRQPRSGAAEPQTVMEPVYPLPETAEEQLAADFPPVRGEAKAGARVLAKWPTDKNFYAGVVLHVDGLGRYKVRYLLDNFTRDMPATDAIPITALEVGHKLMICVDVDEDVPEYQPVTITECPSNTDSEDWNLGVYTVNNHVTEEPERVKWEKFVIDKDQGDFIKSLLEKTTQPQDITDLTPGSRPRRTRLSLVPVVQPSPTVKAEPKKRGAATPARAAASKAPTPAKAPEPAGGGSKARKRSRNPPPLPEPEEMEEPAEPVSEVVQLFKGLKFVLTSANRRRGDDGEQQDDRKGPQFLKKQVRGIIEKRGGTVLDDFNFQQGTLPENCYLVADTHYRTHKYLSALARAVPCVSHMWIYESETKNELLDYKKHLLPAGLSIQTEQTVPWHSKCPTMLCGLNVLVHTSNKPYNPTALDFAQIWSPLVETMGAKVASELPKEGHLDILLTDASCGDDVLTAAEKLGAQAVSSEWLIQAIITGEQPNPKSHKKFDYNFVENAGGSAE